MKKILSAVLAAAMTMGVLAMNVFAASASSPTGGLQIADSGGVAVVYDENDEDVSSDFNITNNHMSNTPTKVTVADQVHFGKTYYFPIGDQTNVLLGGSMGIPWEDLASSNNFTFKLDRDKNGTYLESVKLVTKNLGGGRRAYIAIKLKSSNIIEEKLVSFDVYFKARKTGSTFNNGDLFDARFELWVANSEEQGSDATINTGEGVVFNPVSNETNTITWGGNDDVASLEFTASSDADKFYAKLSTKVDQSFYANYGDPADADLYFRTFSGSSIDATSRATLTLYNPWTMYYDRYDRNYDVNPHDVYIYRLDGDYVEDVTSQFTYVNDDKTLSGMDGWQTRVRTLGAYVISDRELDIFDDPIDDDIDVEDPVAPGDPVTPSTPLQPPAATGSQDFIGLALTLALVSTGLMVTTRKRRK